MPGGRPSLKTPEVVAEICERLANGETLSSICKDERMPAFSTIYQWEKADPEFLNVSARARDVGTHALADECIEIADSKEIDPADKRIRIDTRLRLIGKWNAKKYGEKVEQHHTGEIVNRVERVVVKQ
jgi:hypothetical protein